jgi:hypothetical protein
MPSSILLLFSNPDGFFRRDPAEWAGLKVPALLVLASGILSAISAYLVSGLVAGILPEGMADLPGMGPVMGIAAAGGALLGSFLLWVVFTGIFYVISLVFMGKGTFTRALAAVGYGFLPTAIGTLINVILYWYYLPGLQVTPVRDILDVQQATLALTHSTIFQVTAAIGLIFLVWSASIWVFGIRSGRELSLRDAAITVGVPVILYIAGSILFMGVFT